MFSSRPPRRIIKIVKSKTSQASTYAVAASLLFNMYLFPPPSFLISTSTSSSLCPSLVLEDFKKKQRIQRSPRKRYIFDQRTKGGNDLTPPPPKKYAELFINSSIYSFHFPRRYYNSLDRISRLLNYINLALPPPAVQVQTDHEHVIILEPQTTLPPPSPPQVPSRKRIIHPRRRPSSPSPTSPQNSMRSPSLILFPHRCTTASPTSLARALGI